MLTWFREHGSEFQGELRFSESLAPFTYYKIGGPADLVALPKSVQDLEWLSRGIEEAKVPYFVMGAGSNLLVADVGFRGVVIRSARLNGSVEMKSPGILEVGSSVLVASLLRRCSTEGWGGLEFLTGVPGSIGGVVVMNAGTHLGEACDRISEVEVFVFSGKERGLKNFSGDELKFSYRKNNFLPAGSIVLKTKWLVDSGRPDQVRAKIDELLARRKSSQPVDQPSCGSVFKNPKESGLHAWQVIEKVGLRGHRIGGAEFSPKHSNFIVNLGNAKASDVRGLIDLAKEKAKAELGITLEEEVKYLGF